MFTKKIRLSCALAVALATTLISGPAFAQANAPANAKEAYARAAPSDSLKRMSSADKLLAIEEIRQLPMRYGRCITQKDWECVRDRLFTPDFYYGDGPRRVHGGEGFLNVMRTSGCYDRLLCLVYNHGTEIELLSPTTARGIAAADFTYYYPLGQSFPTTGKEVVAPGQEAHSPTYYYQTYEKVNGEWRIKTSDHVSFDLRRVFKGYTKVNEGAYVTPDGVPPYKR